MTTFFARIGRWLASLFRWFKPAPANNGLGVPFSTLLLEIADGPETPLPLARLLVLAELTALGARGERPLDSPWRLHESWKHFEYIFDRHLAPFGPIGRARVQDAFDFTWRRGECRHFRVANIPEA